MEMFEGTAGTVTNVQMRVISICDIQSCFVKTCLCGSDFGIRCNEFDQTPEPCGSRVQIQNWVRTVVTDGAVRSVIRAGEVSRWV